jgi:DNA (cytosine-5)-methyltransferase 1
MVAHHRGAPLWPARHPQAPDPADLAAVRSHLARHTGRPTAIDLFCGPGGLSLGLERAGFDVIVGADSEEWAVRTHEANFAGLGWCGDLSNTTDFLNELRAWGVTGVDLLAGGVPCQPFSRAGGSRIRDLIETGDRAAHDHRADLWSSFVAVVEALRPSAVLVENVPDLPRWDDGAVLIGLYESLRSLGYQVEARILDGFRHGVPQHRQRLILIGLDGHRRPGWPEPMDELVSLRDAIGDLPPIPRAQRHECLPYDLRRQSSAYQRLMRSTVPAEERHLIFDHISRDVRPDDMEAFRLLGEGQTYIDLPERLRRYRSDVFTDKYKRLSWSELCRSITAHIAKDGYWYIHPDQHRTLSVREAARVQSFPDDFRFAGSASHRYRQIGNAVPVLLGEAIGRAVLDGLQLERRTRADRTHEGFRERLMTWRAASAAWSPPWRALEDPWLVLLGELVLARARPLDAEQTFAVLRRVAPDATTLAQLEDATSRLSGLGIGDRAQILIDVARALVANHGGLVPEDDMELRALPGVGDGVCRAVLTFGFGRRQILLDRTTARVAGRLARHADSRRYQLRLDLHRLAGAAGPDADFNRALLDLGRELCRSERPHCLQCPLVEHCATGRAEAKPRAYDPTLGAQPQLLPV